MRFRSLGLRFRQLSRKPSGTLACRDLLAVMPAPGAVVFGYRGLSHAPSNESLVTCCSPVQGLLIGVLFHPSRVIPRHCAHLLLFSASGFSSSTSSQQRSPCSSLMPCIR